jgi:regulator of cell morphogenesis and NO signaling
MNATQSPEMTSVPTLTELSFYEPKPVELERFNEWDVNSLIEFLINRNHPDIRKNIIGIYDLAQKVSVKHSNRHPELIKLTTALFLFFDDLLFHLKEEEQIFFPNITQLIKTQSTSEAFIYTTFGLIKKSAFMMQKQHQAVVKELMFFRQLTNNYTMAADACNSYRHLFEKMRDFEKDLMLHIHIENDILFPRAIQLDELSTEK